MCAVKFETKILCKNHIARHHAPTKGRRKRKHFCHICAKDYENRRQLEDHVRSYHEKERNEECEVCHKSEFISSWKYQMSMKFNTFHIPQNSSIAISRNTLITFTAKRPFLANFAKRNTLASRIFAYTCDITTSLSSNVIIKAAARSFIRKSSYITICSSTQKRNRSIVKHVSKASSAYAIWGDIMSVFTTKSCASVYYAKLNLAVKTSCVRTWSRNTRSSRRVKRAKFSSKLSLWNGKKGSKFKLKLPDLHWENVKFNFFNKRECICFYTLITKLITAHKKKKSSIG